MGEGLRRGGVMAVMVSENGTLSKNCQSPTPMTLEGNTAVRQAWYHLGRHGGGLGVTLELILASGRVQRGVPPVGSWAHLSEGRGEGRGAQTLPGAAFLPHLRGRDPPPPEADLDPSSGEPPPLP